MTLGQVLYVHPWGHLNDLVIPIGAVACMNAIPPPKLGRYAFEVQDEEIRAAAVVCVDLHWALGLTGFERLVRHVRAIAPDAAIVAGGITAAHLAEELLASGAADYVIRGDAEPSFAALVAALREGRRPGPLPNVFARGAPPPPLRRARADEFDATDSITLDWFPTLARLVDVGAAAFPQGRTLSVARGCPLACPTCYGSHAALYGPGYLLRSPERTAELLRDAARAGAKSLRLIVGKPPPARLTELIRCLEASGPHRFTGSIGLWLCRAPGDEDLDALERAFDARVYLSFTPPDEHVPAPPPAVLAAERSALRRMAARVERSTKLWLDVWVTAGQDAGALRAELGSGERVTVNSGAVWSMSRPGDGVTATLAQVRAAVAPLWTFYAARLLSPALARLLAPFRYLDEVAEGLDDLAPPGEPELASMHAALQRAWRAHRLPTIADLAFDAVPIALSRPAEAREAEGTRFAGDLAVAAPGSARALGAPFPLVARADHRGMALDAPVPALPAGCQALAIVPRGAGPTSPAWLDAMSRRGLVVLRAPDARPCRMRIDLRVQDARAFLLDAEGAPLRRGVADLAYFRAPSAPGRRSPAP